MENNMARVWAILFFVCALTLPGIALAGDDGVAGTVVETMDSGGYTYIQVEKDGSKRWVAVPQTFIRKGDEVEFFPGMEMGSYTSPTLNRTFDNIVFSSGIKGLKRKMGGADSEPEEQLAIAPVKGPDGHTVADLYARKKELDGTSVAVRGKVYKVSKYNGLYWLRIKDGSGSRKRGDHKLVVTSKTKAEKGDIITARGTLRADKSIGALTFEVMVEDAAVTVDGK